MTDAQIVQILKIIHDLALIRYPYPDEATNDSKLVFSLGEIGGIASRTLATYFKEHPSHG